MSVEKRVTILTHDDLTIPDRRITQQARVWLDHGWPVVLIGMSEAKKVKTFAHADGWRQVEIPFRSLNVRDDPDYLQWVEGGPRPEQRLSGGARVRTLNLLIALRQRMPAALVPRSLSRALGSRLYRWAFRSAMQRGEVAQIEWYPLPFTGALRSHGSLYPSAVVVANDIPTLPAAMTIAEQSGALLLYDAHEIYAEQVTLTDRMKRLLRHWEERGMRRAWCSYTNSHNNAAFLQQAYDLPDPPAVLTNAGDFGPVPPRPAAPGPLRKRLGIGTDQTLLLYHGGLISNRNIETLIHGFHHAALPATQLALMGFGESKLFADLIARTGNPAIRLLPAVPPAALADWVIDADYVVIPYPPVDANTRYCSPNKLFDAIGLGVPVLANEGLITVHEFITRYGIGHTMPMDSVDRLSAGLQDLTSLEQPPRAAFEQALAEFGWEANRRLLSQWIEQIETELKLRDAGEARLGAGQPSRQAHRGALGTPDRNAL